MKSSWRQILILHFMWKSNICQYDFGIETFMKWILISGFGNFWIRSWIWKEKCQNKKHFDFNFKHLETNDFDFILTSNYLEIFFDTIYSIKSFLVELSLENFFDGLAGFKHHEYKILSWNNRKDLIFTFMFSLII
jgi:hypothetical protein